MVPGEHDLGHARVVVNLPQGLHDSSQGSPGLAEAFEKKRHRVQIAHEAEGPEDRLPVFRVVVEFGELGRGGGTADAAQGFDEVEPYPIVLALEKIHEHGEVPGVPQAAEARYGR